MIKHENTDIALSFQDYPDRKCKTCGIAFVPKREDQLFCSSQCCNKHHNRKRKNALAPIKDTVNGLIKVKQKDKLQPFKQVIAHVVDLASDTDNPMVVASQISQLFKNRKIIRDLIKEGVNKITTSKLKALGFNSNFLSGYNTTKNEFYLIDVGFQYLINDQIQLFKLSWT